MGSGAKFKFTFLDRCSRMKDIIKLKMCDHFINQETFRVYWFRGRLPIFDNDFILFSQEPKGRPALAKFLNKMENLGGWQVLMNNKAIFDSLSFVEQNIFNFLNELVLRIGDD
jgi:hypothetical protein